LLCTNSVNSCPVSIKLALTGIAHIDASRIAKSRQRNHYATCLFDYIAFRAPKDIFD